MNKNNQDITEIKSYNCAFNTKHHHLNGVLISTKTFNLLINQQFKCFTVENIIILNIQLEFKQFN